MAFPLEVTPQSGIGKEEDLFANIQKLAHQIASQCPTGEKITLAALEFIDIDGKENPLGRYLSEKLITNLHQTGKFHIVERALLEKAIKELKLSLSDLFNPESAQQLGRLVSADRIVTGTITVFSSMIDVNARMIDTQTGGISATASTVLKKDKEILPLLGTREEQEDPPVILENIIHLEQKAPNLNIDIWADHQEYRIGDVIKFYFRADRDCYLTLMDIGTSGNITILFPNRFNQDNLIQGGQTYVIPAPGYGFKINVNGPPGIDWVKAIATTTKISLVNTDFSRGIFHAINKENTRGLSDLSVALDNMGKVGWAEKGLTIRITW